MNFSRNDELSLALAHNRRTFEKQATREREIEQGNPITLNKHGGKEKNLC